MPNIHDTILPEVRAAGRKAYREGKSIADCPSVGPTPASIALNRRNWLHGFHQAERRRHRALLSAGYSLADIIFGPRNHNGIHTNN